MLFEELQLSPALLKAIAQEKYTTPTPIQAQAIPVVMEGRDLLGCAQTGTGKTAAFALPILHRLSNPKEVPTIPGRITPSEGRPEQRRRIVIRALILSPTRELAGQIGQSFMVYGKFTGLRHTVVFGGVSQGAQVQALRRGVDVLVATPGRLMDLVSQGFIDLRHVEVLVLDEADRMMDMGFIGEIRKVIAKLPTPHQTLFFSATMPTDIRKLANEILNNPVKIEVTPVSSTTDLVEQQVFFVEKMNKRALLLHILETTPTERVLVFTRSKARADMLVRFLNAANIKTDAIHSNKSQNARQRALQDFRVGKTAVLVATDIASRGLDVDGISHVVNYDLPNEPETYVHRIGRTGRAGATGIAMSFCDTEELYYLADIEQVIKQQIPQAPEHPYNMHDHTVAPSAAMPPAPKPFRSPSGPRPNPRSGGAGGGGSNNNGSRPRRPGSGGGHSLSAVTKSRRTDAAPKKTALPVGQA